MKVYLLIYDESGGYEHQDILGVFYSRELAEQRLRETVPESWWTDGYQIEEHEVVLPKVDNREWGDPDASAREDSEIVTGLHRTWRRR